MKKENRDRIIIALDVQTKEEGIALVSKLKDARTFKVGLELFIAEGPALFKKLKALRKDVFLDLKIHDIPNTVAGAVRSAFRHGVQMMTVHASGGREMMARAAETARQVSEELGRPKPILLGVTVLTSLKGADLEEIGMGPDVARQVVRLAGLAKAAGMDGVVCSPQEIEVLRKEFGRDLVIVTPGIRPLWAAAQDQKRIMTPAEAVAKGADYLVIGRPVTGAPSPQEAFLKIVEELDQHT
ncbi:MAG: orotidine-5'-phosphate decarboxylase [Candidatus Aminicenantales bacterium]|jgi:orotidine-5'-phosphate decarboxylase